MKKLLPSLILCLLLISVGSIAVAHKVNAATVSNADAEKESAKTPTGIATGGQNGVDTNTANGNTGCSITSPFQCLTDLVLYVPGALMTAIVLPLMALITYLAAMVLNWSVDFTVVHMSANYANSGIEVAWGTVRDVANMGFIFVLLYAAIQTILGIGRDNKKLIVNMIIAAILINFSLFFTKVIIDLSNLLAVTFYSAIVPGATTGTFGIAGGFMRYLGVQNLYKLSSAANLHGTKIFVIGAMGSVFQLITAFSFIAIALMFVIRFVVLIFVLILSPIAFVSSVLPGLSDQGKKWWNALSSQAFFAPIYFLLAWITITVASHLFPNPGDLGNIAGVATTVNGKDVWQASPDTGTLLLNFLIIIAFMIASLIIAKSYAEKAGMGINKATKWAMGAAGGATLGVAGRLGRDTIGKAGQMIGESRALKDRQGEGGIGGYAARLALVTGRKTAGRSFDMRSGGLGGTLEAGKGQKGGYEKDLKDKREREKKFAESLAPTEEEKQRAKKVNEDMKAGRAIDPAAVREYEKEKERQTKRALDLEEKAANRQENLKENKKMSGEERFNEQANIDRMKKKADDHRTNVSSHKAYVESILGESKEEFEKRKNAVDKEKNEKLSEAEENRKKDLEAVPDPELEYQRKVALQAKEEELKAMREALPAAIEAAKAKKAEIEEKTKLIKEGIEKDYKTKKDSMEKRKSVAEKRQEDHAQGQQSGWVTPKIGQKITAMADRDREFKTVVDPIMRFVGNAISHKGRASAAEIRKGKKPVREQLEAILKAEGELKEAEEEVKAAIDETPPSSTTTT